MNFSHPKMMKVFALTQDVTEASEHRIKNSPSTSAIESVKI